MSLSGHGRSLKTFVFCLAFVLYFCPLNVWASCARVTSTPSLECDKLNISFDLTRCPENKKISANRISCQDKKGVAFLRTKKAVYRVNLEQIKEGWDKGKWTTTGLVSVEKSLETEITSAEVQAPTLIPNTSLTVPSPVQDKGPELISFKGSLRIRAEKSDRTDYVANRGFTLLRVRNEFIFKPSHEVIVFIQPQYTKIFGETVYTGKKAETPQDTSGANFDTPVTLHQGFVDYKMNEDLSLIAGRQILSYGDELLVGALDWNNIGRSFDAFRIRQLHTGGWTDFFSAKLKDNNISNNGSGDKEFFGLYHTADFGKFAKVIDFYSFYLNDPSANAGSEGVLSLGSRIKSDLQWFDYRTEYTKQWTNGPTNTNAWQIDSEFGVKFSDRLKSRLSVEGFVASKDFNQLFPTGHKWLGFADVFGRRNISGGIAHLSTSPTETFKIFLDYHYFLRTTKDATAYKLNGTTPLGSPSGSKSKFLGSEIDLTLRKQLNTHMALLGGASLFFPGSYINDQLNNIQPFFYFAQVEVTF